jgi:hypothetical protein
VAQLESQEKDAEEVLLAGLVVNLLLSTAPKGM